MSIKHAFTSGHADGADTSLVRPSNWNADHVLDDSNLGLLRTGTSGASTRIPGLRAYGLPSSPSAKDDEFESYSGWSALALEDTTNVTDIPSHLHLTKNSTEAMRVYGVYKTNIPTPPFTVTLKISDCLWTTNYQGYGIVLTEVNPGHLAFWQMHYSGGLARLAQAVHTDPSTNSRTAYSNKADYYQIPHYLRLVVTSWGAIACLASLDGLIWGTYATGWDPLPGTTLGGVGIGMTSHDTAGAKLDAAFDWIRFS